MSTDDKASRRLALSRPSWLLLALVAALLAPPLVGWWWWSGQDVTVRHEAATVADDGGYTPGKTPDDHGSVRAAADALPGLLSYDYRDLDATLDRVDAVATASFSDEYSSVFRASVAARAKKQQAVTRTVVRGVGLVQAKDDRATVVAFVDQVLISSRKRGANGPVTVSQNRVRVGLEKDGGSWRVDSVDPF